MNIRNRPKQQIYAFPSVVFMRLSCRTTIVAMNVRHEVV